MNDATSEMLNTAFSSMKQILVALHVRLDKIEAVHSNTVDNLPAILENLSQQQQKLEDRFDQLSTANDERIAEIVKNSDDINDHLNSLIDSAIDNYDFDEKVESGLDSVGLEDKITDTVRDFINDRVKVEISCSRY